MIINVYRTSDSLPDPVVTVYLVAIGLQSLNLLFNAFMSPVLIMMCGGAVGMLYRSRCERRRHPHVATTPRFARPYSSGPTRTPC